MCNLLCCTTPWFRLLLTVRMARSGSHHHSCQIGSDACDARSLVRQLVAVQLARVSASKHFQSQSMTNLNNLLKHTQTKDWHCDLLWDWKCKPMNVVVQRHSELLLTATLLVCLCTLPCWEIVFIQQTWTILLKLQQDPLFSQRPHHDMCQKWTTWKMCVNCKSMMLSITAVNEISVDAKTGRTMVGSTQCSIERTGPWVFSWCAKAESVIVVGSVSLQPNSVILQWPARNALKRWKKYEVMWHLGLDWVMVTFLRWRQKNEVIITKIPSPTKNVKWLLLPLCGKGNKDQSISFNERD